MKTYLVEFAPGRERALIRASGATNAAARSDDIARQYRVNRTGSNIELWNGDNPSDLIHSDVELPRSRSRKS